MSAIKSVLAAFRQADRPAWRDALRFAPDTTRSRISKFQPCLPDHLARDFLVRKIVDLPSARRVIGVEPEPHDEHAPIRYTRPEHPIHWITSDAQLAELVSRLLAEPFVALDVETTLTDQRLCLVQLGTRSDNYLVDPLVIGDLRALAPLLASERVAKIIHNAQFEQTVLGQLGLEIRNIVDTLAVSRKRHGTLGAGHSLLAVARRELDAAIEKRSQTSDWTRRPLSAEQEAYAALDVEILVRLALATGAVT